MLWSMHYILCIKKVVISLGRFRYQVSNIGFWLHCNLYPKTALGHQRVFNSVRKSRNWRWVSTEPLTKMCTSSVKINVRLNSKTYKWTKVKKEHTRQIHARLLTWDKCKNVTVLNMFCEINPPAIPYIPLANVEYTNTRQYAQ